MRQARQDKRRSSPDRLPDHPWSQQAEDVCRFLGVEPQAGLGSKEINRRIRIHGKNRLRETRRTSSWQILLNQFKSLVIALLVVAGAVSFAFAQWMEGIGIIVVVVLNAAIGFVTELRAVRSMEALRRLGHARVRVRRDEQETEMPADRLVPGDIVLIEAGDVITADLRLIEASRLQVDESSLTGESTPASKDTQRVAEDTPLADRASMLFKGTAVNRGSGSGVVVATGMNTELGRIASLAEEAEQAATPLEHRLEQLGRRLIWITLAVAAITAVTGIVRGREIFLMIETGIALAVAAVPEGLPIVATLALARGMWRMARHNALINRLSAVETLGAASVIFSDKTGTLTENRMTVQEIALPGGRVRVSGEGLDLEGVFSRDDQRVDPGDDEDLRAAIEIGVLCNNASVRPGDGGIEAVGEPLEVALLVAGAKAGLARERLLEEWPEVREEAFDPQRRMMATVHEKKGRFRVAVKGAAEAVLECCTHIRSQGECRKLSDGDRGKWVEQNSVLAGEGLRVLALAEKTAGSSEEDPYAALAFAGFAGMLDPPREDVKEAIRSAHEAGVRVVMVTGDQAATALSIARSLDLVADEDAPVVQGRELPPPENLSDADRGRLARVRVFARIDPKQKLDLIELYQQAGAVVAMTGDGVNDAPALRKADIGVAMGRRGTQVACEAADMILSDDAFSSIVRAIRQGRVIYDNIRRFVLYLLSCNISEIMVVFVASLLNAPMPVLPLQILYLNLVTDVFPALALGFGEGDANVMRRPPRDSAEPILPRRQWIAIVLYGLLITVSVLAALLVGVHGLELSAVEAVTVSFLTLAFAQLWHVFNMRQRGSSMLRNDVTRNPWVWGALALCVVLLLVAVYVPGLSTVLRTRSPGLAGWGLVLGMSLVPVIAGQIRLGLAGKTPQEKRQG